MIRRCPLRPTLDRPAFYQRLFWLYGNYTRGILPEDGGLSNQPALLVEAFEVLDAAYSEAKDIMEAAENRKRHNQERLHAAAQSRGGRR